MGMTRKQVEEYCEANKIQLLLIDGHDNAILRVDTSTNPPRLVYSQKKIIKNLENEMEPDDALDFFEFNVAGSYMGELTPKIV